MPFCECGPAPPLVRCSRHQHQVRGGIQALGRQWACRWSHFSSSRETPFWNVSVPSSHLRLCGLEVLVPRGHVSSRVTVGRVPVNLGQFQPWTVSQQTSRRERSQGSGSGDCPEGGRGKCHPLQWHLLALRGPASAAKGQAQYLRPEKAQEAGLRLSRQPDQGKSQLGAGVGTQKKGHGECLSWS